MLGRRVVRGCAPRTLCEGLCNRIAMVGEVVVGSTVGGLTGAFQILILSCWGVMACFRGREDLDVGCSRAFLLCCTFVIGASNV